MTDGFRKGTGCFTCKKCGKKTRITPEIEAISSMRWCEFCILQSEHWNSLTDNDKKCTDPKCPYCKNKEVD